MSYNNALKKDRPNTNAKKRAQYFYSRTKYRHPVSKIG